MAKPYFPPPGGEHAGYRQPGGRPLDEAPPPAEERPKQVVTRPDDPDVARAKAEYGDAPAPPADSRAWLRPFVVTVAILIVGIQLALILRSCLHMGPR